MSRRRYTAEQIIGKLWEAEVALSAISPQFTPRLVGCGYAHHSCLSEPGDILLKNSKKFPYRSY
jgi:hypothetical protein